ncbi:unnamed protein product, partial [marine sediment metagenome]
MKEITYLKAINEAVDEEMQRDPMVLIMGEDIRVWGAPLGEFKGLFEKYGAKRVLDTPISERAIIGAAIGAAATGLRPITHIMFAEFLGVCMSEIWGQRSLQTAQDRHAGFHTAVDASPLITVIESSDSNWSPEQAANITMDMLLTNPEIGGVFSHGGEAPGVVEGLRSIGRLTPLDDPDHIIVATNDIDTLVAQSVIDGTVDACGSHQQMI